MSKFEYIFGIHAVNALLAAHPRQINKLYLQNKRDDERLAGLTKQAERAAIQILRVSKHELDKLVSGENHQGVVAECRSLLSLDESALPSLLSNKTKPLLFLILDGIQDPHNLGACLRSANAFGTQAVIAPKDRAVGITPVVRKVACGAEAVTPFIQVTNLARTLRYLQEEGVWLVGTTAEAEMPLADVDMTGHIGIVLGSEGEGMRQLTQKHCDFQARIPMVGSVESLNVSVACAICLYEVQRQRKA
jgi:23S rRNA (guanosine2251-2'-O)-methyltransferase